MSSHNNDSCSSFSFALLSVLPSCTFTLKDVLVTQRDDGDDITTASPFQLCTGPTLIGGNRLQVLCDMHRAKLDSQIKEETAITTNNKDAISAAAQEIVQIVMRDYQAKFVLVDNTTSPTNRMASTTISLDTTITTDPPESEPQQSPTMIGLELTPQLAHDFVTYLLEQAPAKAMETGNGGTKMASSSQSENDMPGHGDNKTQSDYHLKSKEEEDEEEAKKRRRRSSLLRRSVTEDGQTVSMKKSIQNFQKALFGSAAAISLPTTDKMEPLDVILNARRTALIISSDNTHSEPTTLAGNNRLDVLISIKEQPFRNSSAEQKVATLEELYKTVTDFWGGRFLAELPAAQSSKKSSSQKQWLVLDKEEAKEGLMRLLDPSEALTEPVPPTTTSSSNATARRPSLLKLKNPLPGLDFLTIRPAHSAPPTSNSSIPTIHHQEDKLRSAAVASLQRRKKRQGLTSKIRKLTTNLLTKGNAPGSTDVKAQQDRFAEANFDTAPPMMMRASSGRDEYGGGADEYGASSVGRRASMSRTPSQDVMPPPARRQGRRGDLDDSFARRGSSKSFSGSFHVQHNDEAWYNSTQDDADEMDELAERAKNVAGVDGDEDDGGMLAILQRQLLAKAAAEAAEVQRSQQQGMTSTYNYGQSHLTQQSPYVQQGSFNGIPAVAAPLDQSSNELTPYRDTYHAVMPSGPLPTPAAVPMVNSAANGAPPPNHSVPTFQQPHHLPQVASFEVPIAQAKARMSGQRFSGISELDDTQLQSLLTGLDVSESDLDYNHEDEGQRQAQV